MTRIELPVEGMTCQNCVRHVAEALEAVPGVTHADVSLEGKRATVEVNDGSATRQQLTAAVQKAGYRVPEPVQIKNIDPVLALQSMTFYLKNTLNME